MARKRLTNEERELLRDALKANHVRRPDKIDVDKLMEQSMMTTALQTAVAVSTAFTEGMWALYAETDGALTLMGIKTNPRHLRRNKRCLAKSA